MTTSQRLRRALVTTACVIATSLALAASASADSGARTRTQAWIPGWDRAAVLKSLAAHADALGGASPFWFELTKDGAATTAARGAWDGEVLAIAAEHDITLTPTVTNSFDTKRLTLMLRTPATRTRHVAQLVAIADRPIFAGLDVDYENLAVRDRAKFVLFVEELATALHARGKVLSVTVMAATGPTTGSIGARATDYAGIALHADEVRVMAYDLHWACGRPGPIAPMTWVRPVVTYLVTQVPADKLVLGVPLYGYDWPKRGCATARTWRDAMRIQAVQKRERVTWAPAWSTRVMRYLTRTMWFEDADATEAKAALAAEFGLKGIAMWRLGGEDPATWERIAEQLGGTQSMDPPINDAFGAAPIEE